MEASEQDNEKHGRADLQVSTCRPFGKLRAGSKGRRYFMAHYVAMY
jgi:hypothetical protein